MGHTVRGSKPIIGLERPLGLQEVEAPRICRHSSHEGGKIVSPTHWWPQHRQKKKISLTLISVRGWVDTRTIVWPEGLIHWHHRKSNPRHSGWQSGASSNCCTPHPRKPAGWKYFSLFQKIQSIGVSWGRGARGCQFPSNIFLQTVFFCFIFWSGSKKKKNWGENGRKVSV
jgi:hypothetical protein